jgi:hypothetical protein
MAEFDLNQPVHINFETIQRPLRELSETIAQKMYREAPSLLTGPQYVGPTLFTLIRQAMYTCDLLFYLHADERRESDCYWKPAYTFVSAPLIRSVIDCLFNVTLILQNSSANGPAYCLSGFKKELRDLDEDEQKYGGRADWEPYFREKKKKLALAFRQYGTTEIGVRAQNDWPTLGRYVNEKGPGNTSTDHQTFLKTFTYGMWREYSAMSHGGFEGLLDSVSFYTRDAIPREMHPRMDQIYVRLMSLHMGRAAIVMLCIVTEVQAHFRFMDANINARIHRLWDELIAIFEAREIYNERYSKLMTDRGIKP